MPNVTANRYDEGEEFIDYPTTFSWGLDERLDTASNYERLTRRKAVVLPGHFIKTDTPDRHYTAVVQFKDYPHLDFSVPVLKDEKGLIPVPFPPSQYAFHSLAPHAL